MTEMMRSKDSFLERKRCSLRRASPGWRPSDEKSCGSVGGQLLTLYDVPDPQLSYCCLNTTSDGELTTSRAATSNAGRVGCGKVSPVLGQICSSIVLCPLKMYKSPPPSCLVSSSPSADHLQSLNRVS